MTEAKITLGRMLYYDTRFSKAQQISCNSCHGLATSGVDGEPTSPGHRGQRGARNSPSVYNAAFHVAQFWDGRAADVEEQAKGPVLNPIEMGMPGEAQVIAVIRSIPGYPPLFQAAFPGEKDPISYDNFARAIGAFERRLVTSDRFDAFLEGNDTALTDTEVAGLETFLDTGCTTCHMGPTIGGKLFQKLGLVEPYPTKDTGRFEVTKNEADRSVLQGAVAAQRREDGPLVPRRLDHDARRRDPDDGAASSSASSSTTRRSRASTRSSRASRAPPTPPTSPCPSCLRAARTRRRPTRARRRRVRGLASQLPRSQE